MNFRLPWVDSTRGPPPRISRKLGRKVNQVTTVAATAPARNSASGPKISFVQPPMKPTNATTMINGPGVVSPSARPSIIWVAVSQAWLSTAPW